jgi:protein phosphatase
MKHCITYAALCHIGKIRSTNQDNLWCAGTYLESENEGLVGTQTGTTDAVALPAFAVFDGMGGEQKGEVAAYIAASQFNSTHMNTSKSDTKLFLLDACFEINTKICEFQKANHIRQMGTTATMLLFGKSDVFICNVGDSRVYLFSGRKLTQISCDHIEGSIDEKKPPLTQHLGIPETEFVIEPYIAKGAYNNGDRYLVCSDGLTDMVSDEELSRIIAARKSIPDTAKELLDKALGRGGIDNITIILCEVRRQKRSFPFRKRV